MDVSLFRANYTNSSPPYRIRVGEFAIDFRAKNAPIYIFGTRLNVGLTLSTEEFKSRDGTVWGVDGNGKHVAYSPYFSIYNFVEGRVNGQKNYLSFNQSGKLEITKQAPISTKNLIDFPRNYSSVNRWLRYSNTGLGFSPPRDAFKRILSFPYALPYSIAFISEDNDSVQQLRIQMDETPELGGDLDMNNFYWRNLRYLHKELKEKEKVCITDEFDSWGIENTDVELCTIEFNFDSLFKRIWISGKFFIFEPFNKIFFSNRFSYTKSSKMRTELLVIKSFSEYFIINRSFNLGRLDEALPYFRKKDII